MNQDIIPEEKKLWASTKAETILGKEYLLAEKGEVAILFLLRYITLWLILLPK